MSRLYSRFLTHGILLGSCPFFYVAACAEQTSPPPSRQVAPADGAVEQLDLERLGDSLLESGTMEPATLDAAEAAVDPLPVTGGGRQPRAGRWKVAPHFELKATYDDNIFITSDNQVEDFIVAASPGLRVGYWDYEEEMELYLDRNRSASVLDKGVGNFLVLDYTATLLGFAKTSSQNTMDQKALFDTRWHLAKLDIAGGCHFVSTSEADRDLGGRVRRNTLTTEVTASYQFSERLTGEVGLANVIADPEGFTGSVEWRNEDYVDYQVTPLLRAGLGGAVGRIAVEDSADQVFERILGRVNYEATGKLGLRVRGGVEFRQSDGTLGDRMDPVFDGSVRYAPAEATLIVFEGFRRVEISAAHPDDIYTTTGCALRFERTLRAGLQFSVEGGYAHADYAESFGDARRKDDFFYVRAGVLYNFARWGNVGLGYEYRSNSSSRASSSFENTRITVQAGLSF